MTFLRFGRPEYEAIAGVCRRHDLHALLPHTLKSLLVGALAPTHPALARRLAHFRPQQCQILLWHLRGPRPARPDALTAAEVERLAEAFGPLVRQARFAGPLKRAMVLGLLGEAPELAQRLHSLRPEDFQVLCQQLRQRQQREV
jgi:hypothetical protein